MTSPLPKPGSAPAPPPNKKKKKKHFLKEEKAKQSMYYDHICVPQIIIKISIAGYFLKTSHHFLSTTHTCITLFSDPITKRSLLPPWIVRRDQPDCTKSRLSIVLANFSDHAHRHSIGTMRPVKDCFGRRKQVC